MNVRDISPTKTNMQMKLSQNTEKSASSAIIRCILYKENHHTWKFCTNFVCQYSERNGIYTLSHGKAEHIDLKSASAAMIGTEPPETNVVRTSSLEHIGILCLKASEGSNVEIHKPTNISIFISTPIMRQSMKFDCGTALC
jgi:hypothetical protein